MTTPEPPTVFVVTSQEARAHALRAHLPRVNVVHAPTPNS